MSKKDDDKAWATLAPILKQYMGPEKPTLFAAVFCGVVGAAASGFGLPFILNYVFPVIFGTAEIPGWLQEWMSGHIDEADRDAFLLWGAVAVIPLAMGAKGLFTFLNTYLLTICGVNMLARLRTDIFARLQWLSFSYHDRNKRGKLMTYVIQYTQIVQQNMVTILNDLVIQPLTLVSAAAFLIYFAVESDAAAMLLGNLIITALCIPVVRLVGKKMVKQMRASLASMNIITETVEETFAAQREVRAFNLEQRQETILRKYIRMFNTRLVKMAAWKHSLSPMVEIVSAFALSYSLFRSSSYGLTLEAFSAIATAFYFCYDPIKRLGDMANNARVAALMVRELMEVVHAKDETPEPAEPLHLPAPVKGAVEFKDVTFGYSDELTVLKDVSVSVPAGQIVALVGPSGSGKTTFINLICRFYDVQQGSVEIDGIDVRRIPRKERVAAVGLVSQFPALFRGSIMENIRVGRPGASDAEAEEAGAKACVQEFVSETPEGYARRLDEGGGGLSGGQRQRVSIARAFLKNAPILILDEATSALDMKSEAAIQGALAELAKGHTTFIIAHRFSTIRMAQRILVFEEGRIVADGTHDVLYENCVLYRHLYDEQVRQADGEGKEAVC